jgi:hypothetical protein
MLPVLAVAAQLKCRMLLISYTATNRFVLQCVRAIALRRGGELISLGPPQTGCDGVQ